MTFIDVLEKKYGKDFAKLMKKQLKRYDPQVLYGNRETRDEELSINETYHKILIGKAFNLITDMIDTEASPEELAKAVKYAWVVLDTAKYHLNHKKAYEDYGIKELYAQYHIPRKIH